MYNVVSTLAPSFLIGSSLFLQATRTVLKPLTGLKFGKIGQGSEELAALERFEKNPSAYNERNVVSTLEGFLSFLQVTRTTIKAFMSLNFGQILLSTTELAVLECLKNQCIMLSAL